MSNQSNDAAPTAAAIANGGAQTTQSSGDASAAVQSRSEESRENGQEESQDEIETYTPDEETAETLRILSWPAFAYYEILGLDEDVAQHAVRKAYHKKSRLTHTDKNKDPDAKEVFQRVTTAYEILSDDSKRKTYNEQRKKYKLDGSLVQKDGGEAFAKNAYATGDDDDDSEDDEDVSTTLSKEKEAILTEMTPLVCRALKSGGKSTTNKLEELDQKMQVQNKAEGIFTTSHCLPLKFIKRAHKQYKELLKIAQKEVRRDEDIKEIKDAEMDLKRLKEELRNRMEELELPLNWTISLPAERQNLGSGNTKEQRRPEGRSQTNNGSQGQTQGNRNPPRSYKGTKPEPMDIDPQSTDITPSWKSGQTTLGENILAYRQVTRTFREAGTERMVKTENEPQFVIEVKGKANPIALVSSARVGYEAVEAYMRLPEDQKNNLVYCQQQYTVSDRSHVTAILGYARSPFLTDSGRFPYTVLLIQYDGEKRFVNRSALQRAVGQKRAEQMIANFLQSIGEAPEESETDRLRLKSYNKEARLQIQAMREGTQRLIGPESTSVGSLESSRQNPSRFLRNNADYFGGGRLAQSHVGNHVEIPGQNYVTQEMLKNILNKVTKQTTESILTVITEQLQSIQLGQVRTVVVPIVRFAWLLSSNTDSDLSWSFGVDSMVMLIHANLLTIYHSLLILLLYRKHSKDKISNEFRKLFDVESRDKASAPKSAKEGIASVGNLPISDKDHMQLRAFDGSNCEPLSNRYRAV